MSNPQARTDRIGECAGQQGADQNCADHEVHEGQRLTAHVLRRVGNSARLATEVMLLTQALPKNTQNATTAR